jgi:hypothetical protein
MVNHLQTILKSPEGAKLIMPENNNTMELFDALNK